jgi:poly-gamma-glutamate synthesis protein (capsule biosynthesis protein)
MKYGFLATACNHSLDFGFEGVASTIRSLVAEGIAFHGVNAQEADAFRATIIRKKEFTIGLLAYTFGLNAHKPPAERPHIVNTLRLNDGVAANDFSQLERQLQHCREEGVDFIVAHLHWGLEHEFYPTPEQVEIAHHLVEMGVDAIIGHHPHVIQPFELYRTDRDPQRVAPIFYSLGNLINGFSAPYLTRSGLARITLTKGSCGDGSQRTYVEHAEQIELQQIVDEEWELVWLKAANSTPCEAALPNRAHSRR